MIQPNMNVKLLLYKTLKVQALTSTVKIQLPVTLLVIRFTYITIRLLYYYKIANKIIRPTKNIKLPSNQYMVLYIGTMPVCPSSSYHQIPPFTPHHSQKCDRWSASTDLKPLFTINCLIVIHLHNTCFCITVVSILLNVFLVPHYHQFDLTELLKWLRNTNVVLRLFHKTEIIKCL